MAGLGQGHFNFATVMRFMTDHVARLCGRVWFEPIDSDRFKILSEQLSDRDGGAGQVGLKQLATVRFFFIDPVESGE